MAMGFREPRGDYWPIVRSPPPVIGNGQQNLNGVPSPLVSGNNVNKPNVKRTKITARKSTNSSVNRQILTREQNEVQQLSNLDSNVNFPEMPTDIRSKSSSSVMMVLNEKTIESNRSNTFEASRLEEPSLARRLRLKNSSRTTVQPDVPKAVQPKSMISKPFRQDDLKDGTVQSTQLETPNLNQREQLNWVIGSEVSSSAATTAELTKLEMPKVIESDELSSVKKNRSKKPKLPRPEKKTKKRTTVDSAGPEVPKAIGAVGTSLNTKTTDGSKRETSSNIASNEKSTDVPKGVLGDSGFVGQTYSKPRMNGQIRPGTRILRSLKPKRALILERLRSPLQNENEVDCHQMLPVTKEIQERNLIDIAARFSDLDSPLISSVSSLSLKLPKVKKNVNEVLQTIPANMADKHTVPLVLLDFLKPGSEKVSSQRRSRNTARSARRVGNRTSVSLKRAKHNSKPKVCKNQAAPPHRSHSVSLKSKINESELPVRVKEEPLSPLEMLCEDETFCMDLSASNEWNDVLFPDNSSKSTGRKDGHFFGKHAYMVGRRIADYGKRGPRYATRRLSKKGHSYGKRPRSWKTTQQKRKRLSGPDIDVIDGMEFLSFESDEDLKRFIRNNPGRICKGPPMMSRDALRQRSASSGQLIIPTKTKDITKIKGWRNKVFDPQAISTLDDILNNLRRKHVQNVAYKNQLMVLPSCSSGTSTSIGFTEDDYVDPYTDPFYDEDTKYGINLIDDYGFNHQDETSVFDDVQIKDVNFDLMNDDTESIKSIDLGILSSECIDEELRKRDEQQNNIDSSNVRSSRDSFSIEDLTNRAISNSSIKSAFVSDFLDDFLKNQSELKVKLPQPMYVSPNDIDTKVVWPSHEMAVLDQVPIIPEAPRKVLHPAFRQRKIVRPGNTTKNRPRSRGRPPKNPLLITQDKVQSPPEVLTYTDTSQNTVQSSQQQRGTMELADVTLRDAVFAANAIDLHFVRNEKAIQMATCDEINQALSYAELESPSLVKARKRKCAELSITVSPYEAAFAAAAVVQPKHAKEQNTDEGLNAWERFLRTTSTNSMLINQPRVISPDTNFCEEHEETSPVCDTTVSKPEVDVYTSEVVSADTSQTVERVIGDCEKEFCQMGCVCDSLKVRKRRRGHCGKVQCMFSCSCNPFENIKPSRKKKKCAVETEVQLPKKRRQIRIPARLKDSVYFYGGDGVEKDLSKNTESSKEEKYNKYKMKPKNKPHLKQQVKIGKRSSEVPLKWKAINLDFRTVHPKQSYPEFQVNSELGLPKNPNSSKADKSVKKSSVPIKPGGPASSSPAIVSRLQEQMFTSPLSSPTKPLRVEFTFKPMTPIVRPASSRSIPTILRRSGAQTARKSLNPTAQYQSVPYGEQSQAVTVGCKQMVESSERVEVVVKNVVEEMVRKVGFQESIGSRLQNQIVQRARMSCFEPSSHRTSSTDASSGTVNIRFPLSTSRQNLEKRGGGDGGDGSTEKMKRSREEKEQNRRKALRFAFTHLAMVACPVVKDMWSQRNRSFSITAFVFRMACTAIGRLRQQEKKLVLYKQSLMRERMELFNKYTEYLKDADLLKQKETIKELALRLQLCCRERNQRNKDSEEHQKRAEAVASAQTKPESQRAKNWIPVTALPASSISSRCITDSNSNLSLGDPIGKVGNKPILLGDSVMIGGTFAASLRPTGLLDLQDGGSMKTIRLQSQKGGMKWISLQGKPKDSLGRDSMAESNVSVTELVRKPSVVAESKDANAGLFKKPAIISIGSILKNPSSLNESTITTSALESNNAVTVKSDNSISSFFKRLRDAKNSSDSASKSVEQPIAPKQPNQPLSSLIKNLPTEVKTNKTVSVVLKNLSFAKKIDDLSARTVLKSSVAKKTMDTMLVSMGKAPTCQKTSSATKVTVNLRKEPFEKGKKTLSFITVPGKKPSRHKEVNDSVDESTENQSTSEKNDDSVPEIVKEPSDANKSDDSETVPAKNPHKLAVKFSNSDTLTYLPTKSPSGSYMTVAELLRMAKNNQMPNLNIISSSTTTTDSIVVSSLHSDTLALLKSTSNGSLLALRPTKDSPALVIGVAPTTSAPSNRTLSVGSSSVAQKLSTTSVSSSSSNKRKKTSSNPVPRDANRFVVIKPKPIVEQSTLIEPPDLSREMLVVSPVDDTPLNIEDLPKRKRGSIATLLRQKRDAAKAAAVTAALQPMPIIVPLHTTYPQPIATESLLGGMNTLLTAPIAVPSNETPNMLFSPITEDDFVISEDLS